MTTATNESSRGVSLSTKIHAHHRDRLAVIYVRQSSPHQVAENRESADLQYQLRRRAVDYGWDASRVLVIDDDQGISGQSIEGRPGFQRLLAEISLGQVGIVFGREVSRLSRSNKDWHHLLELCSLFGVVIGDADGVYDPMDPNDRLLLGLRGMMSEAELHVLKSRLYQGKLNKARRGELFTCVPMGYVRGADGGIVLDPDEQVRSVIAMIFAKFSELGSVPKVLAYLAANGVRIGVRPHHGPNRGQIEWRLPNRRFIYDLLRNPTYAGAYVYGRTPCDPTRRRLNRSKPGRRTARPEEWVCLLKDRIPAYITWQQFETNGQRLRENDRGRGAIRTARGRAPTLLNGIVRCGHCSRPMAARNTWPTAHRRYACDAAKVEFGAPRCQSLSAAALDRQIEKLILLAVEPAALELSLRAAEQIELERERLHRHWRQTLARAEYDANRAKRQYDAVDPDNRLVARELECQWERQLAELRRLQEEYLRFQQAQPRELSAADRERIQALATDVPALWQAPTTTGADRRAVVRQLMERVIIARRGRSETIDVTIHWRGGNTTQHEFHQGLPRYNLLSDYAALKQRVLELRGQGMSGKQISDVLNREGFRPARGEQFSAPRVLQLLIRFGQARVPAGIESSDDLPQENEWWLPALAQELGMEPIVLHRWRWSGWIHSRQLNGHNNRCIVWADAAERNRLRRLRAYEKNNRRQKPPAELRTPRRRRGIDRKTMTSRSGTK
jgi:DNA invertase Pin-like site-specific DNA recombinase